jgi:hypothetical protein
MGPWKDAMLRVEEIRDSVWHYLAGHTSLEELDDWLTRHSWNMHLDSLRGAQEAVGKIELSIAEYLAGHLSMPEFRDSLLSVLNDTEIHVAPDTLNRDVDERQCRS